ncbi:MAG: serine/threonine protein kinase, partial [Coleofasciculaceae cyanobacterium SM2_3_26]|nr:serine/threonine protein kinase [Coleofasciculaceae cyanobacterium SM2_3_26]
GSYPTDWQSTAWLANAFAKTNAKQANHSKAIAGQAIAPEGNTTPKLSKNERSRQQTEQAEQAERVAAAWLRVAYNRAAAKDFAGAVRALEQISPETAVYAYVPTKLAEYHWKKDIRAVWLLQQAYNCAAAGAFAEALNFLNQIPPDAQVFETARLKILEYTQKQKLLGAIY